MCYRLETSDKPLSMDELQQEMGKALGSEGHAYSIQHMKSRLVNHYGSHIFFAEVDGRKDVVCLRDMASFIINAKWYTDKNENYAYWFW